MDEIMLKVDNVSKMYKLGQIGGTTLRDELQRFGAKLRHKEDPTQLIGAKSHTKNETFMALNGVSFEVKKGERVGIIGHNGAGKSTLLKLISRITAPTGGTISMNGRVASMLEVGTGFNGELTGRENIYMNGAILGMTKKEIDAKIEDIIEFSECRQFIDTPVKRYSSGMYVKLAFSVAAHLDSEIMIMDEVLAVGDMAFQKKCLDKMNEVSKEKGRTILYVSHNMNTIRELCNRIFVLQKGKLIFDGGVEKGLSLYYNNSISNNICSFNNMSREACYSTDLLKIISFEIFKNGIIQFGEKISGRVVLEAFSNADNIKMEIALKSAVDDCYVTRFYNRSLIELEKGKRSINFEIDCSFIVPGTYILDLEFKMANTEGNVSMLDGIHSIYSFEIISREGFNFNRPWSTKWSGYFSSPDLQIDII